MHDNDKAANNNYTAGQIEIQRIAVAAWIAHAEGKAQKAQTLMQAAADQKMPPKKIMSCRM